MNTQLKLLCVTQHVLPLVVVLLVPLVVPDVEREHEVFINPGATGGRNWGLCGQSVIKLRISTIACCPSYVHM